MPLDIVSNVKQPEGAYPALRLRLSDYLWRSRLAKGWWAAAAVYWVGFCFSPKIDGLADFYQSIVGGFLLISAES